MTQSHRSYSVDRKTFILSSVLALLPLGCFWGKSQGTGADGAGGQAGDAGKGSSVGGNATASGGANSSNGGSGSGEGGASTAGSTLPDVTCASDITCKSLGLLCDTVRGKCAQCLANDDCSTGVACVGGVCGGTPGCLSNDDCAGSATGKVCDATRGRCVGCLTADDCPSPSSSECTNNQCITLDVCQNSLDCKTATAPVCDKSATVSHCVACVSNADCAAAGSGLICAGNQCVTGCAADSDCSGGLKCNTSVSPTFCAACAADADCATNQYCKAGTCAADVCNAGVDQACMSSGIATCNSSGSGFDSAVACPGGQSCSVSNSVASCGIGSPSGCTISAGTVNPCSQIPAFPGTQTVDGDASDFCGVPAFQLSFANAAGVNNNVVSSGSTSGYPQRVLARIAWSADAIHAFFEVYGDPVRAQSDPGNLWNGDSIELMLTTNSNPPGLTSQDSSSLHIIANYTKVVSVKSTAESGTPTELTDNSKFKVGYMTGGYFVELQLPWPGTAPTSGSKMRLELAMNVDSADIQPGTWARDAQAVLAMTALTGTSTCSASPATPFCDERLWCPTTLK